VQSFGEYVGHMFYGFQYDGSYQKDSKEQSTSKGRASSQYQSESKGIEGSRYLEDSGDVMGSCCQRDSCYGCYSGDCAEHVFEMSLGVPWGCRCGSDVGGEYPAMQINSPPTLQKSSLISDPPYLCCGGNPHLPCDNFCVYYDKDAHDKAEGYLKPIRLK